jgi:hypothetical protein
MSNKLRLSPDYMSSGLWWIERADDERAGGEASVDALQLSAATKARLAAWIRDYESQLDWDDPGHSPPSTAAWERAFRREAIYLWHQIQIELGPDYEVYYGDQTIYDHPQRRL